MERKEKIKRLDKEIEELKKKKEEKDKVNKKLDERNRLKFPWLYKLGRGAKNLGKGFVEWAGQEPEEVEEPKKKRKQKRKKKDEIYEALFGESNLTGDLGI